MAGVSVEYYSKLDRGAIAGVSASVLDAIARALQLDDAERAHLFHLAQAADEGLVELKGHRSVGGIRASIYNAMPVEGVRALAGFMRGFAADRG